MIFHARKCGNSVVITIPIFLREKLGIKDGTPVDIDLQGQKIIIRKENKNV